MSLNGFNIVKLFCLTSDSRSPKFSNFESSDSSQLFSWLICQGCKVGKADDISKKGDRTKVYLFYLQIMFLQFVKMIFQWGFVFSVECSQETDDSKEIYFVTETEEIGANWVQLVYDARHLVVYSVLKHINYLYSY